MTGASKRLSSATPDMRPLLALSFLLLLTRSPGATPVDFNREVRPIISEKCYHCHGPDEGSRKAKLRLDVRDDALQDRDGVRAIVPGKPDDSELMLRVRSKDPDEVMPPPKEHHIISPAECDTLRRWIAEGANYAPHWAFGKPVKPAAVGIDAFIDAELKHHDLALSPEADKPTLIRRLSLDLTGLPPTLDETRTFVEDTAPDAYARAVDRLLASPHFGERWARMWLDLARYADSSGYGSDFFRLNIWPWRDWVIGAFNRNLPYDQFTIEQLAGDLLPNPTREQLIATAFHRNTMTNFEGGTPDEEYRVAAVKDRVATTMQVWMGLTAGCAQCHTHKFDPLSQREYYQLFAIFNQTEDADRNDEEPKMPLPTADEARRMTELNARIAELETQIKTTTPELDAEQRVWEAKVAAPVAWSVLEVEDFKGSGEQQWEKREDGSVLVRAGAGDAAFYEVKARTTLKAITAVRLELIPDAAFNHNGPGRAADGNAVLSDLKLFTTPAGQTTTRGRFVRIVNPGSARFLSLAEVEIFSDGKNAAPQGQASQSTTGFDGPAKLAVDGNTDGDYFKSKSVTHTQEEKDPWWEVDLGRDVPVERVVVWNRTDSGVSQRLADFRVEVLDAARQPVFTQTVKESPAPSATVATNKATLLPLFHATADYSQPGFDVARALDGDPKTGWGIGGATGQPHAAVFELVKPWSDADALLTFQLTQSHGGDATIGRFRLLAAEAATPVAELPAAIKAALGVEPAQRTAAQAQQVAAFFRPLSKTYEALVKERDAKKKELATIKPLALPIIRDLAKDKQRESRVFIKGNYLMPGDIVTAGLPAAFHAAPAAPLDRLALAQWLVSRDNPLTARVTVNRFWAQLFGTGIVESEEDFGTQGSLPSHPELLDWLAIEFMRDWDVKRLLKLIVTSATYRQSAKVTPDLLAKDPRDRLLSRYPRRRLGAEEVHDQALAVAGLLSHKIGGPSVYPPQPDGLWNVAFNGGQNKYPTSEGEDRYRRGLYTFWRRTMANPTMLAFDAPSRETCTIRRVPTNTPLQAFVTLNDPVFVESAQALARRILREGGADADGRLRFGLELALGRPAEAKHVAALRKLLDAELVKFRQTPDDALTLATKPLGPLPAGADPIEAAAWTAVANVLLNLDAFLTRS